MINLALWVLGVALMAAAVWRIRRPYARLTELDRLAENARRYESWRGGRSGSDDAQTGAGVMRQMLRRELTVWTVVAVVGVLAIFAGFAIR